MEEGYYELDISGNLNFFNAAFLKIVGYSKNDLKEQNFRHFTELETVNKVFRVFNNVYVSRKPFKRNRMANCTKRWCKKIS